MTVTDPILTVSTHPDAACAGTDPKGLKFWPPREYLATPALRVCASCDILDACRAAVMGLDAAMDPGGVWGGMTHEQRRRIRSTARARASRSKREAVLA